MCMVCTCVEREWKDHPSIWNGPDVGTFKKQEAQAMSLGGKLIKLCASY